MTPLEIVLVIAVAGFVLRIVLPAIQAPIRVRRNNWHKPEAVYEPCASEDLAPEAAGLVADVANLGFVVRGHWRLTGHSAATGKVTLLEHPKSLDVAKVVEAASGRRHHCTLLFQTRFADGTELTTANNQSTVGLPVLPETTVVWLPEVGDAARLYRIHDQVRDSLGAGKRRLPVGQDAVAFLHEGRDRIHAHHVETGYFFLDDARGVYRPTWKGAVLMTWRLLWPIRPIYRAGRRRRTHRLLRELGVSVEPDQSDVPAS